VIKDTAYYSDQFGFQRLYSNGRILNVGCNTDGGGLKQRGALNLDLSTRDNLGQVLPVDVIADARALPFAAVFDTVVLGEILEHMERPDAVATLKQARAALKPTGKVVITMPHDGRRDDGTLEIPEVEFYTPGVYAFHYRNIPYEELASWLAEARLKPTLRAAIDYLWGEHGSGIVAVPF